MILFGLGCSDVENHTYIDEQELITTVELTFEAMDGDGFEVIWDSSDTSIEPVIDTLYLDTEHNYSVFVRFLNGLESPAEDLTPEIQDEGTDHQVFFLGSVFDGLLMHTYNDADENGLPLGIENTLSVLGFGEGDLTLALRHMPKEGNVVVKVDELAEKVKEEGFDNIGGENDVFVSFPVIVSAPIE